MEMGRTLATHSLRNTISSKLLKNQAQGSQRLAVSVLTPGRRLEAAATLGTNVLGYMTTEKSGGSRDVTPLQLVGAGTAALSLGALAGFSSHYLGAQLVLRGVHIITSRPCTVLPRGCSHARAHKSFFRPAGRTLLS